MFINVIRYLIVRIYNVQIEFAFNIGRIRNQMMERNDVVS